MQIASGLNMDKILYLRVVPGAGVEPARENISRDFKSLASTYSATRAHINHHISSVEAGVGIEPASAALQAAA